MSGEVVKVVKVVKMDRNGQKWTEMNGKRKTWLALKYTENEKKKKK